LIPFRFIKIKLVFFIW